MFSKRISVIKIRPMLTWLLSIWSLSIGLRFLLSRFNNEIYKLNEFDFFFDWCILFTLGTIICCWHVYDIVVAK